MKLLPIYLVCFSVLYFGFVVITLLFSKSIRKNKERILEKIWSYISICFFIVINLLILIGVRVL